MKNKMMRAASVLMVAVLLSTCAISGTFAKYVTQVSSSDAARVAKWGFNTASINFEDLFAASYDNVKAGTNEEAIIAPGTSGKTSFTFQLIAGVTPEVSYSFMVSTQGSSNGTTGNTNIKWRLTNSETAPTDWAATDTWDKLIADIQALDGTAGENGKDYLITDMNNVPEMIDKVYYVHWVWPYGEGDHTADANILDNQYGNVTEPATITLQVTITATQID